MPATLNRLLQRAAGLRARLPRIQSRFARSRPGSVLILVIALLVLMALIGTAWITTARNDRYGSVQNTYNVQIDMLVDGVIAISEAAIAGDVTAGGAFRPIPTNQPASQTPPLAGAYYNFDAPITDNYLASRTPGYDNDGPSLSPRVDQAAWSAITGPLVGTQFEAPYAETTPAVPVASLPATPPAAFSHRSTPAALITPSYIDVNVGGRTTRYPSLVIGNTTNYLAADTDGDGIADALLFRLPMGQMNGLTYYGAVRIFDNNSAINASVAWKRNALNVAVPGDFFPSNVGLSTLTVPLELANLNTNYRFGKAALTTANTTPIDDTPTQRADFMYGTETEAFWMQFGRRLGNPGINAYDSGSPPLPVTYQALPISESIAMAHRFCLVNPSASLSLLETYLQTSTHQATFASQPYSPDQVAQWFSANFDYVAPPAGGPPLRALLVARNPVTNFAPNHYKDRGAYVAGSAYAFGDEVQAGGANYICIHPTKAVLPAAVAPTDAIGEGYWAKQSWSVAPTKVSVNAGTFGQLWTAFWSVMDEGNGVPPAGAQGQVFRSPLRDPNVPPPATPLPALTASQTMMLRSALAAVNTLDLRDADDDVTSREIYLPDPATGIPQFRAMIYGTEKQPYITEVYADNDPAAGVGGYIAVELHNPYNTPITLANWQLGVVNRTATGLAPLMTITPITDTTTGWKVAITPPTPPVIPATVPIIPPGGYVVLASSATGPGTPLLNASTVATPPTLFVLPTLTQAFDRELILFRPRRGDNALSNSIDPNGGLAGDPKNPFDENLSQSATPDLAQLVPVDSYDFSGLVATPPPAAPSAWHYIRPSAMPGQSWRFVYPGKYTVGAVVVPPVPRLTNTAVETPPAPGIPPNDAATSLGLPDTTALGLGITQPLQLNNIDFAGPAKTPITAVPPFGFPFGGFARNGDILQVPFIGGYIVRQVNPVAPVEGSLLNAPNVLLEINTVTMDSTVADDNDATDDAEEQIGRFCPIDIAGVVEDYGANAALYRYNWALDLFDYLTVQSPQDDHMPDVDPAESDIYLSPQTAIAYPTTAPSRPQPVANGPITAPANANNGREDAVGVEGLININTAGWRVLATLPMVPAGQDLNGNGIDDNIDLAHAIVNFRDCDANDGVNGPHGAFKSIFELNKVTMPGVPALGFQNAMGAIPADPDDGDDTSVSPPILGGDLSPLNALLPATDDPTTPYFIESDKTDHVSGDFETKFLMVNRISNLITTRSDTFTVYLQVQGWRGIGTTSPELLVQRRAALLVDRSSVSPTNHSVTPTLMPTD